MTLAESSIPGFHQPVRLDRTAQGGGVAIWVKEDLEYEHLSTIDVDCQGHEIIWLRVQMHPNKLILGALHRPGSTPSHDTAPLEYLDNNLDDVRGHGSNLLLAGDFNVHKKSWLGSSKTTLAGELEEVSAAHNLEQHVHCATRGKNPLDLILSDLGNRVAVEMLNPIGSSDHATLLASVQTFPHSERPHSRTVWRYSKADWGRLNNFFKETEWNLGTDPNPACRAVTEKILHGTLQFIPSKRLSTRPFLIHLGGPQSAQLLSAKNKKHGNGSDNIHQI